MSEQGLTYKGKPLVRSGNTLYYGSMADPYVVKLEVKSTEKVKDLDVAGQVSVQLMSTDPNVRPRKRILKSGERDGLANALDVAAFWLERALTEVAQ